MSEFIEIPASKKSLASRKLVCGIGVNDANYMVCPRVNGKALSCPYYTVWVHMIRRCYSDTYQKTRPTYKDCSVVKEWFVFSSFKKWMDKQEWQGMALDKDIKIINNKEYGPESCLFVTSEINNLFNDNKSSRGRLPVGVHFCNRSKKLTAQCRYKNKAVFLGYHKTPESANAAYKKFKNKIIIEAANQPENEYIKEYLLNHATHLLGQTL